MLKRSITYTNFDGEQVTEILYFNLSEPELIELEIEHERGLAKMLRDIIETQNPRELVKIFKELLLLSYGIKSEDGRQFIKSEELSKAFSQTEAYNVLYMELAQDDNAAVAFFTGILPKSIAKEVTKEVEKTSAVPDSSPKPPTPPNS